MFSLQPTLKDEYIKIVPLQSTDFERLYAVASDANIWVQHPNKNRYQKDVFENYFEGAIQSQGAFLVFDQNKDILIGCTRFYDFDPQQQSILIGYTFLATTHWGGQYNKSLKSLMLNYAFEHVDEVLFHIGANNIRSQRSMERLGGKKIGTFNVAYFGEEIIPNFIYQIKKIDWIIN